LSGIVKSINWHIILGSRKWIGKWNMASIPIFSIYEKFIEYLASKASPQEILDFAPSEAEQARATELLGRNSEGTLTAEEKIELEQMLHFERFVSVLKAKALADGKN
jgi:hypothetical protein